MSVEDIRPYAELVHEASLSGGPEKWIDCIKQYSYEKGYEKGTNDTTNKANTIVGVLIGTVIGYCAKLSYDRLKKKKAKNEAKDKAEEAEMLLIKKITDNNECIGKKATLMTKTKNQEDLVIEDPQDNKKDESISAYDPAMI